MLKNNEKASSVFGNKVFRCIFFGIVSGVTALVLFTLFFSIVLNSKEDPHKYIFISSLLSITLASFIAGFTVAKINKCNGLIVGIVSGVSMAVINLIVSFISTGGILDTTILIRLVLIIFAGAAGGVVGVNLRKKPKYS